MPNNVGQFTLCGTLVIWVAIFLLLLKVLHIVWHTLSFFNFRDQHMDRSLLHYEDNLESDPLSFYIIIFQLFPYFHYMIYFISTEVMVQFFNHQKQAMVSLCSMRKDKMLFDLSFKEWKQLLTQVKTKWQTSLSTKAVR